jgi:hypothetical protein
MGLLKKKKTKAEVPFSLHSINIYNKHGITFDVGLDQHAKVVFLTFLHCNYFSFPIYMYIMGEVIMLSSSHSWSEAVLHVLEG